MSRRDEILALSLELFNTSNIKAITTNHISEKCGISPGNLYYHFQNKEEIIRTHFSEFLDKNHSYRSVYEGITSIEQIDDFYKDFLGLAWHYRYFFRERFSLCNADPELNKMFEEYLAEQRTGVKDVTQGFVDRKIIPFMDENEIELTTEILCIFLNNWEKYYDINDKEPTEKEIRRFIERTIFVASRRKSPDSPR